MATAKDFETTSDMLNKTEDLKAPNNTYFYQLSEVQWSRIKNGLDDSDIKARLADLMSEIVQLISTDILKTAIPLVQDSMKKGESPADMDINVGEIKPSLGEFISANIQSALDVPQEDCEGTEELSKMLEEEISNKIKSVTSLVKQTTDLPSDPAVYVSGTMTNIKNLSDMVSHAGSCIKRYAGTPDPLPPTSPTGKKDQTVYKDHFCRFAQKHFKKMQAEIKSVVADHEKFFICLKPHLGSPKDELTNTMDGLDFQLPGSVPESPRSPKISSINKTLDRTYKQRPLDFNTIRDDISDLFDKLTQTKNLEHIAKTLENIRSDLDIQRLSRELSDKMYDHLMVGSTYKIPRILKQISLSAAVISRTPQKIDDSEFLCSPEVLYVIVEDAVGKFLQKILLWVEMKALDKTIHSDPVFDAVKDIQPLMTTEVTSPQETPVLVSSPIPIEVDGSQPSVSQQKTTEELLELYDAERIHCDVMIALIMTVFRKTAKQYNKSLTEDEHRTFCRHMHDIMVNKKFKTTKEKIKFTTTMLLGIYKEFGTSGALFEAAWEYEGAYLAFAVMKHLKTHLFPPKKSKCSKFLKAVGKCILPCVNRKQSKEEEDIQNPWSTAHTPFNEDVALSIINDVTIALIMAAFQNTPKQSEKSLTEAERQMLCKHMYDMIEGKEFSTAEDKNQFTKAMLFGLYKEFGTPGSLFEAAVVAKDRSFDDAVVKHLKINLIPLENMKRPKDSSTINAQGKALKNPVVKIFEH